MRRFSLLATVLFLTHHGGAETTRGPDWLPGSRFSRQFRSTPGSIKAMRRTSGAGRRAPCRWSFPVTQRLQAKIDIQVDGNELARRRVAKASSWCWCNSPTAKTGVYFRATEAIDLQQVKDDIGKSNVSYIPAAFVAPRRLSHLGCGFCYGHKRAIVPCGSSCM